jgi:membrane fusion protein, multidrug efflux system
MKPADHPTSAALEAAAANSAGKMRHAALVALVLIVAGALAGLVPRWRQQVALATETRELAVQTVGVVCPAPGTAALGLTIPAEIKPWLEAPIYSRSAGYLKRYLVDIGAHVEPGDLLAETDAPELLQELQRAKAELLQAEAALALAKVTAARWADLVKTASVSEQEAVEKQADFELKSANVEAARANVRRLEELKSFAQLKAPFAGTITARGTDVGQLISPASGKELFRLAQTSTLRVYVRVPQTAARGIVPGQMAELTVLELPGRVYPAKVITTSGALSPDSRTLLVELQVENSEGEILAGTYGQVRFTEAKLDAALTLPSNVLLFRAEGTQVGVVRDDSTVELRNVTLGRDFGPTLEIVAGVGPTDRVILNPPDSLVAGIKVRVVETSKTVTEK